MARSMLGIFFILIILSCTAQSQSEKSDSLSTHEGFWGLEYLKGSHEISSKEFTQILKSHPDQSIYELYSSGNTQSTIAQVFAFSGGFSLGYGLTTKPTNTTIAVAGGIVAIGSFVLASGGKNKMNEALSKYNGSLPVSQCLLLPVNITPNAIVAVSYPF
jgi:hypothetical protein